jgi:hypothetical protein
VPLGDVQKKIKTVLPRILVIDEKQYARARNPLALQVNYEILSQPIRY